MAGSARNGHSRGLPRPQQGRRGLHHGPGGLSRLDDVGERRTRNIGHLLLYAADAFVTDKLRKVNDSRYGPATQVHIALIQNLDLDGNRLTLIAARAQMTKQSMLELVDKAVALGLVGRRPDPDDRRAKIVAITPSGARMMGRLRKGVAEAEQHMAAVTGAAFLARMHKKLAVYTGDHRTGSDDGLAMSGDNAACGYKMPAARRARHSAGASWTRGARRVVPV